MPQASDEQRQEWAGPDDRMAINFLEQAGYTLIYDEPDAWCWQKPTPGHKPTETERSAVNFLIDEWDYGGIINKPVFCIS